MKDLFKVEVIKLKSTIFFKLLIIFPFAQALIHLAIFAFNSDHFIEKHTDNWAILIQSLWGFWCVLSFPLFIGLLSITIFSIEHNNNTWRSLFTLGIKRWKFLVIKFSMLIIGAFISLCLLSCFTILTGKLLNIINPKFIFESNSHLVEIFLRPIVVLGGAFLMITISFFISSFIKNFIASFGLIVFCTMLNMVLANSESFSKFYPWTYPAFSQLVFGQNGESYLFIPFLSILLSIPVLFISIYTFTNYLPKKFF